MEGNHGAGKGDTYRKLDYEKWSRGWDSIFGDKKKSKRKKSSSLKKGRNEPDKK